MRSSRTSSSLLALVAGATLALPVAAQTQQESQTPTAQSQQSGTQNTQTTERTNTNVNRQSGSNTTSADAARVSAGQKQEITGFIVRRDGDNLIVRDRGGAEYNVMFSADTKIRERKSNPFRGARKYETTDLVRGLRIEVEGRGNDNGALVAREIKFSEDEFRTARSIESRVDPVEGRVGEAENRLSQAEQNAQRLSGQIEELTAVANTARGGARAAQETADQALSAANTANQRVDQTNERITSLVTNLDDYEARQTVTINFMVGSAVLSPEAKAQLDEIANQAKSEKGHIIQVAGFASADGNEALNRRLSQRRAEAVMSYLIENHDISQRRIITPLGYGEARPAADNTTREGRQQNRRVEVAILVNKGLTGTTASNSSSNTDATNSGAATTERKQTSSVPPQQQ
jgi:outer membrane protein OmpA-like peptidoglycan-associated protein